MEQPSFSSDLLGVYGAVWGLVWWTIALNKTMSPSSLEFLSHVKFIVAILFSTVVVCLFVPFVLFVWSGETKVRSSVSSAALTACPEGLPEWFFSSVAV